MTTPTRTPACDAPPLSAPRCTPDAQPRRTPGVPSPRTPAVPAPNTAGPVRAALLGEAHAARALDIAERLYAASLGHIAGAGGRPESTARYGGATIVAEALARAGRAGDELVRAALERALVFTADRLSLYGGAGGLLIALGAVDPARASLRVARAKLCAAVAASLDDLPPGDLGEARTYDLIGGPAGRAIALARATGAHVAALAPFARVLADDAERLITASGGETVVNLGVSHGIAGVLAALNLALPDDRATARRYTDLLLGCAHDDGGALRWGAVWRPGERPTARRAWCYQTVGIAAVLAQRARIDGDAALRATAAAAIAALLEDDEHDAAWDAALCHGRAGVATIAWSFAEDERLVAHAARLARALVEEYDERKPLGYDFAGASDGQTGFLDGALGVAQFLVDAATAQERRWLPLFGLAPD